MILVESRNGIAIRLSTERWTHIIDRHPEMSTMRDQVLETITKPNFIQSGDFGELLAVRHYDKTPLTSKFLIVAYREIATDEGFVLTAYLTRRPSARREVIWKP